MIKSIWKFELFSKTEGPPYDPKFISMPPVYKMLDMQWQGEYLVVWALVNISGSVNPRKFLFFESGQQFPHFEEEFDNMEYLGTAQTGEGGWYVTHIFLEDEPR